MAIITCAECSKPFSDKALSCPHCGCPIEFARVQNALEDAGSLKKVGVKEEKVSLLRDYLEKVRLLEIDIYTLQECICNLAPLVKPLPLKREITPPVEPMRPSLPHDSETENVAVNSLKGFGSGLTSVGFHPIAAVYWGVRDSVEKTASTIKKNKETNKRNVERQERYERDIKYYVEHEWPNYQNKMTQYVKDVLEEEQRYAEECAQVEFYNQGIAKQIELAKMEKDSAEKALQKLYEVNVLFPKYRGIVPVTMFCEYMDSGRRTTLGGVSGMYDLYEQELLANRIVDSITAVNQSLKYISYQMEGISSQLSGIARNQIMLHEEVARGNAISKKISQDTSELLSQSAAMISSADEINHKLGAINKSTEMAAYNTKIAARRVDAIAKIQEYEHAVNNRMFHSV